MNEMRLPELDEPPAPPPMQPNEPASGSLALGVGLAWAINVIGAAILFTVKVLMLRQLGAGMSPLVAVWCIPLLASVTLAIWMILKGRKRTGIGILIGIGSIWAVSLLLVAACFGLVVMTLGGH